MHYFKMLGYQSSFFFFFLIILCSSSDEFFGFSLCALFYLHREKKQPDMFLWGRLGQAWNGWSPRSMYCWLSGEFMHVILNSKLIEFLVTKINNKTKFKTAPRLLPRPVPFKFQLNHPDFFFPVCFFNYDQTCISVAKECLRGPSLS